MYLISFPLWLRHEADKDDTVEMDAMAIRVWSKWLLLTSWLYVNYAMGVTWTIWRFVMPSNLFKFLCRFHLKEFDPECDLYLPTLEMHHENKHTTWRKSIGTCESMQITCLKGKSSSKLDLHFWVQNVIFWVLKRQVEKSVLEMSISKDLIHWYFFSSRCLHKKIGRSENQSWINLGPQKNSVVGKGTGDDRFCFEKFAVGKSCAEKLFTKSFFLW